MSFPGTSELGRDPASGQFQSLELHRDAETFAGIVVYRFEAPLVYSNASAFARKALALVEAADQPIRTFVVDCEVMFEIDYTGIESLEGLLADLRDRDVELRLARVHGTVLARLRSSGALEAISAEMVFERVEHAVTRRPGSMGGDR